MQQFRDMQHTKCRAGPGTSWRQPLRLTRSWCIGSSANKVLASRWDGTGSIRLLNTPTLDPHEAPEWWIAAVFHALHHSEPFVSRALIAFGILEADFFTPELSSCSLPGVLACWEGPGDASRGRQINAQNNPGHPHTQWLSGLGLPRPAAVGERRNNDWPDCPVALELEEIAAIGARRFLI